MQRTEVRVKRRAAAGLEKSQKSLTPPRARPFPPGMRISGYGGAAANYASRSTSRSAAQSPKPAAAQPVPSDEKHELKSSDGFASAQPPPGVGEKLNIKA